MKISLAIPTRSRGHYLRFALQSALVAAGIAGCEVEIVVSDNASDDDTADIVSRFSDRRLIYRRTPARYSMRQNFEFALSQSSGSHVVFIGDDDAVLPNGLRILGGLIAAHDPDIVKWRVLNYLWPNPAAGARGSLEFRPQRLDGRLRFSDPRTVLQRFARADFKSYREGGMIYHGCVSRRLIDRAQAGLGGPYFRGSSPDVFTSMQALMVSEKPMLNLNLPVTLGGASPRSNGVAALVAVKDGKSAEGSEYSRFVAESAADPYQCQLPAHCESLSMAVLDCLQTAAALHCRDLKIDIPAWQRLIAQDLAAIAEPGRGSCLQMAREVLGLEILLPPLPAEHHAAESTQLARKSSNGGNLTRNAPSGLHHSLSKLSYVGGKTMEDANAAALMLDRLLDLDGFKRPSPSLFSALLRTLKVHSTARKFIE